MYIFKQIKEKQTVKNLGYLDFGARMLETEFGRWFVIDPLAEKYYSVSPYVYCMNNPLRYIDPNGMEFTEAAWKQVNRLIDDINKRQQNNTETIAKKQAQIDAGGLSNKKVVKFQKQIDKLNNNTSELEDVRGEISTLAVSNQMYDIRSDNSMNIEGAIPGMGEYRSGATFNFTNGNFEMSLGDGSLGMLAHELKHAYQFETGAFSSGPDGLPFYDQSDEWEAYARGALFGGQKIYSLPSIYNNLPKGPIDATNHPHIKHSLNRPDRLQKIVNMYQKSGMAFRIKGTTYRTIYDKK
jgi:RHS repeat-associated protein